MRRQRGSDGIEQALERDHVMQRLVGDDAVVASNRLPFVEVGLQRNDFVGETIGLRQLPAAFQHALVQFEAFDHKIIATRVDQCACEPDLGIAIAGPDADEAPPVDAATVAFSNILRKKSIGIADADGFEAGPQIPIRPVVEYRRQRVDFLACIEILALCGDTLLVTILRRSVSGDCRLVF